MAQFFRNDGMTGDEHALQTSWDHAWRKWCYVNGPICRFYAPLSMSSNFNLCIFYFPYGCNISSYSLVFFSCSVSCFSLFSPSISGRDTNQHPSRKTVSVSRIRNFPALCSSAAGRNTQFFSHTKTLLKYFVLFHHYSNYHMLRSRSQQIYQKFVIQKYIVVRSYMYNIIEPMMGNSSCSLVLKQLRILEVLPNRVGCFGRCILKSILFINGLLYPFSVRTR